MTTETAAATANLAGDPVLDPHQKALAVNLDATSFGSFAEIGAGQEVARSFLRVGGASGTVAKTVSAYDKVVSDDLYGAGTRYVSKERLEAMLASEWKALQHQVGEQRGETTRFFAFANTIAARNFSGTNDCHGWMGVRFQHRPLADPSDIMLHVNLRDNANLLQQEAVGILGVNLIHSLMASTAPAECIAVSELPARLFDSLSGERIEIDQITLWGDAFSACDMGDLHVGLARGGRAEAVTLSAEGEAVAANEFLYKKALILAPAAGNLRDGLSPDAIAECVEALRREVAGNTEVKGVLCVRLFITKPGDPNTRVETGSALITRHQPLFRASAFVRRYSQAPLRFALTLPMVMRIFDEVKYDQLDGRLLEGVARLFGHDVRVLAYPSPREDIQLLLETEAGHGWEVDGGGPWVGADQIRPAAPLKHLYDYLLATGFLIAMPPK